MPSHRLPVDQKDWTEEQIVEIANLKRFTERYQGDPKFRERFPREMHACMEEYGFDFDPEAIRPVWDADFSAKLQAGEIGGYRPPDYLVRYSEWLTGRLAWRDAVRAGCEPTESRWKVWRERQMSRASGEMGAQWCESIIFDTAAIELSKGCSVGCWFCGVDAPKLEDHLLHTQENGELFSGVVQVLSEIVGPRSASAHFLYWASDPLDNPDYEEYCERYRQILGVYPLTTTALALKDVDRTRRILSMLAEDPTGVHRFSILTLKMLDKVHEAFTARELIDTELVLLNKGSMVVKANAGRFRKKAESKPALLEQEMEKVEAPAAAPAGEASPLTVTYSGPSSIACVSGLLVNLVEKSVKLVTPCKASDRWPLGYVVFEETSFDDPADLKGKIGKMVQSHMSVEISGGSSARLRADLDLELEDAGFFVGNGHSGLRIRRPGKSAEVARAVGRMLRDGDHTVSSIVDRVLAEHAVFPNVVYGILDPLFAKGYLFEEPESEEAAEHLIQLGPSGDGSAGVASRQSPSLAASPG